ncbi:hypothetical protein ACE1CI_11025 [Aerosakkonemataceae cyanobacterium BLCC-F50]|uniref:Uncharacterized protein n=1 Tax=Floridaenema flaviceps BLCC-F50 TaxID=3153642 RepID=A0ABV4XPH3_9CYAN
MNVVSKAPFQGIELHCMGYFPITFLERRESYETTLNLFEISPEFSDNTSILNRPTHVFRSSPEVFEKLKQKAMENKDFLHVEIVESDSDLGLPCYLYAKHKSGEEIFFDGIIFRITSKVSDEKYDLADAMSRMSESDPPHPQSIKSFNGAIEKIQPNLPLSVYTYLRFYTALKTDWDLLKIEANGDPSMQIPLRGSKYSFYIGDYERTLKLIAHDFYQSVEIKKWRQHISSKIDEARNCFQAASDAFVELSKPFYYLNSKFGSWSKAKKGFTYLLQELPLLYRYELLIEAYEKIADENLNNDNRSAVAHWEKYFFKGEIENNQIANISEKPLIPNYTEDIPSLKADVAILKNALHESFALNKDLFASVQTEFAVYSIWVAILGIVIPQVLGALPLLKSPALNHSSESENLSKVDVYSLPTSSLASLASNQTILSFETSRNAVRIFTRNGQTLMNIYNKQRRVTWVNSVPVHVEQISGGIRYSNLQNKVVVEVVNSPVLFLNREIAR